jgi:hypothetical protein
MPTITTGSGRTGRWAKMQPFGPFSGLEKLRHKQSLAAFIIIVCGFRFSVHTRIDKHSIHTLICDKLGLRIEYGRLSERQRTNDTDLPSTSSGQVTPTLLSEP